MKYFNYIESRKNNLGDQLVLWNTGNYMYEIENRTTNKKTRLNDTSFEMAKSLLEETCASH